MDSWVIRGRLSFGGSPQQMRDVMLAAGAEPTALLDGWSDMSATVVSQHCHGLAFVFCHLGRPPVEQAERLATQFPQAQVNLLWLAEDQQSVGRALFKQGRKYLDERFTACRKFRRMVKAWFPDAKHLYEPAHSGWEGAGHGAVSESGF